MRFELVCHPDHPPHAVRSVRVEVDARDRDEILLTFRVEPAEALAVPEWKSPARARDLWKTTCFELFVRPVGADAYFEFNLSPSTEWAAYAFDGYRSGMRDLALLTDPHIRFDRTADAFELEADLDLSEIPNTPLLAGLSAVIEEIDGTLSYWALAHPPGKADFHDPACFALTL